jgi:hypothetical protein
MSTTAHFSDLPHKCEAALVAFLTANTTTTAGHMAGVAFLPGINGDEFNYPAVICYANGAAEAFYGTQFHWVSCNAQVVTPRTSAATVEVENHKLRVAEIEDALLSYAGHERKGHYNEVCAAIQAVGETLHVVAMRPGEVTSLADDEQWTYNRQFDLLCEWVNTATT